MRIGSRYIYELYYDKEAISKTLYDWLLKNGYADGNLIAKWKKQGYEKVRLATDFIPGCSIDLTNFTSSCAAYGVSRLRKRISTPRAYAESRKRL